MPTKSLLVFGTVFSAAWLGLVCFLAERFSVPSADGIMYSLPLAFVQHPFDLGIPFLNDFDGYGSSWGHNWPGAMWLRAAVFTILPYSRLADVGILSLFQLLTAWTAGMLVFKASGRILPAAAAWVLILSDRVLLQACAGHRFEAVAVAVVLLLFAATILGSRRQTGFQCWVYRLAALICPLLHPYALLLGGLILGFDWIRNRHREGILRLMLFAAGCAVFPVWFLLQPEAWQQFSINLALQESFYRNWNTVIGGLENYRLHGGLLLWAAGLIAGLMLASRRPKGWLPGSASWTALAPALLVAVIALHTATRCENFHYLTFGSPFAVMMVCIAASSLHQHLPMAMRWLPATALLTLVALHAIVHPYRLYQFKKAGMPNLGASYHAILDEIPASRTVFIPHPMWAAAIEDRTHTIRWFTFPIASRKEIRRRYEDLAYATTQPGDVLIVNKFAAGQPDRFGVFPTFPTSPPDPTRWRHLRDHTEMFPGAVPWGINLSVFEYQP